MAVFAPFAAAHLEALAKVLGECGSGTDISRTLEAGGTKDHSGESTKWRRLYWVFRDSQDRYGCANHVVDFVQAFLSPARFVGRGDEFELRRRELNAALILAGMEYGADGRFREVSAATTVPEAERRSGVIRAKFQGRRLHPEVLKYCRAELMQENYFHAVFEAAKGLAQRLRELSDVQADGAALVDRVFSLERPVLAINALRTETERSEHKGFAALLKGCFAAVRNPLAHEPKILWDGADDAADYLSLISLLHRKLDDCIRTGLGVER